MAKIKWSYKRFEELFAPSADDRYIALIRAIMFDLGTRNRKMREGPWLAGGTLRRLYEGQIYKGADLDFYFRDNEQKLEYERFIWEQWDAKKTFETDNATTYTMIYDNKNVKIQFIHGKFYLLPSDVIADFDLTCCQLVTNGQYVIFDNHALADIADRKLRLNPAVVDNEMFAAGHTIRRMIKLGADGYKIGNWHINEYLRLVVKQPELIRHEKPMSGDEEDINNPFLDKDPSF